MFVAVYRLQIELPETMWLHFEEGDHFGFSFTNGGVVSYDSDSTGHYCDASVSMRAHFVFVCIAFYVPLYAVIVPSRHVLQCKVK